MATFLALLALPEQSWQFSHVVRLPASSDAGQRTSSACKDSFLRITRNVRHPSAFAWSFDSIDSHDAIKKAEYAWVVGRAH